MKLVLENIEVDCIIGDLPSERVDPQRLSVDIELEISGEAAFSDRLEDTVDYAALAQKIRFALVAAECRMIERAAKIVYDICISGNGVKGAIVKVRKPRAVEHLSAAVAIYPG